MDERGGIAPGPVIALDIHIYIYVQDLDMAMRDGMT